MTEGQTPLRFFTESVNADGVFDPTDVALLDQERILLESADVVTKIGEKSLLFFDLALRFVARDHQVEITAVLDEARPLLTYIKQRFAKEVVKNCEGSITLAFSPLFHHLDLLEKMRAPSALDVLRSVFSALLIDMDQKKNVMVAGAFSYDFLDHFEKLEKARMDHHQVPDYVFFLPLSIIVIDHVRKQTTAIAHGFRKEDAALRLQKTHDVVRAKIGEFGSKKPFVLSGQLARPDFNPDIADEAFLGLVAQCQEHIRQGDVYQIVPSRVFSTPISDAQLSYQVLRQLNPSPYMFYLYTKDWTLFGASPETFIKVDGKQVAIRPIAGTRRRGFSSDGSIDEELDSREQASLCLDEKELAEHMMLVDLARNDIACVSRKKTRRVTRLLGVDRYSHVMHLVSEVAGSLQPGFDALSAYQASMNMGTLMGAPKVRAAELLRDIEPTKRGFYGGAVGYLDGNGNLDTAIIIRSALVRNDVAYVRAGCGVVFDSSPQFEVDETKNKAEAVLRAIELARAL